MSDKPAHSRAADLFRKYGGLRFAPPNGAGRVAHDPRLDGLRGFAAFSVMIVHGFWFDAVAGGRQIPHPSEYLRNLHMSRAAVLLFFITSGYVIGLTNRRTYSWEAAKEYLRRRCLRIEPIYLLAIVASCLAYREASRWVILANALFLQNPAWHIPPLPGDSPVWTLHNEVVYYLGFLLLWALRPRVVPCAVVLTGLAAFDWFHGGVLSFLGGWSVGALFWLSGLLLSWGNFGRCQARGLPILGLVVLAFATNHLWPGVVLLKGLGFPYAGASTLWLADLALLPATLSLFCEVTQLDFPGRRMVGWTALLIPLGTCVLLLAMGRLWESVPWTMSAVATIAALPLLALRLDRLGEGFFRLFRPLGKISYALYLFHVPCVVLVSVWYPWSGGWLNYAGAFACWFALTVAASWVCEAHLQAALLSYYKRRTAHRKTA